MRSPFIPLALAVVLLCPIAAKAADRPVVVELFTSQGCSSCPPADALLSNLAERRGDVLPLAFHVTYWNNLGWHDPFSLGLATDRQAIYAGRLGAGTFTPQMVVDGRASVIGSRQSEVSAAIAQARGSAADSVAMTLSQVADGVAIDVGPGIGEAQILLIGFDRQRVTPVGRGENGGRTLSESNIVRSLRIVASWRGAAVRQVVGRDAGEDAAIILQAPDGHILGAARLRT